MLKKRGQGLSITTIIIAVIALIVLVVLIAVFTGRIGSFNTGVKAAGQCNDLCKAAGYGNAKSTSATPPGVAHPGLISTDGTVCSCDS